MPFFFSQKNNKSTGTDLLCAELFKSSFDILSPFLLKLYNRLLINVEYLRLWEECIIVPIFKGRTVFQKVVHSSAATTIGHPSRKHQDWFDENDEEIHCF